MVLPEVSLYAAVGKIPVSATAGAEMLDLSLESTGNYRNKTVCINCKFAELNAANPIVVASVAAIACANLHF